MIEHRSGVIIFIQNHFPKRTCVRKNHVNIAGLLSSLRTMKRYQVGDPENISGILEDEVKNIEEYLPSLPWPAGFNEKEQAQLNQFREAVKDHIHHIEGHYLHTDLYLSRYILN
jgi:hypothetical protein